MVLETATSSSMPVDSGSGLMEAQPYESIPLAA
jgi:hypothetical protein